MDIGLGKRGERGCNEHMIGGHVIKGLLSILQIHYTLSLLISKPILSPRASLGSQLNLTLLQIQLDALVKSQPVCRYLQLHPHYLPHLQALSDTQIQHNLLTSSRNRIRAHIPIKSLNLSSLSTP